ALLRAPFSPSVRPTGASSPRLGDVHGESAAPDVAPIESVDRLLGGFSRVHLDESEPAGAPAVPVSDDLGLDDFAVLAEQRPEVTFGGAVGEVTYVEVCGHVVS